MSRQYKRELLISGYTKQNYTKSLPSDVSKLCVLMYGLDDFTFIVSSSKLTNLLSKEIISSQMRNQQTLDWNTTTQDNKQDEDQKEAICCKSDIFYCNGIKFQIIIKPETQVSTNNNTNWGADWGNSYSTDQRLASTLTLYINLIDHYPLKNKIAKISFLCSIHCKQTNVKKLMIIDTSYNLSDKNEVIIPTDPNFSPISLPSLEKFDTFELNGYLDVCHIEKIDKIQNKLLIYHNDIKLKRSVKFKWKLNNNMIAYKRSGEVDKSNYYFSPHFDNDNWCFMFTNNSKAQTFEIDLMLLSLPVNIESISISQRTDLSFNSITHSIISVAEMSLKSPFLSFRSWGNEFKYSLFGIHFIQDEKKEVDLGLITITVYIQIYKAKKQNYYERITAAWKTETIRESQYDSNHNGHKFKPFISKERFHLYGIIKGKYEPKKHFLNKLVLQKEISLIDNDNKAEMKDELVSNGNELQSDDHSDQSDENELLLTQLRKEQNKGKLDVRLKEKVKSKKAKKANKANKIVDEYSVILSGLKTLGADNIDVILNNFKTHAVTDKRLNDLDDTDWRELIPSIGIRNEMKKLAKESSNSSSKMSELLTGFCVMLGE